MTGPVKILLADDHRLVRQGLRKLLEAEPGFSVLGEAAGGPSVVDLARRLKPDVVVMDLLTPALGRLDAAQQIKEQVPGARIVVISFHAGEQYVAEALRRGASAYVPKEASAADLIRAIREAAAGRRYLSPPLSEKSLEAYLREARRQGADPYDSLTPREREVFHLTAEGMTSIRIAERLGISPRTAEAHRAHILRKLSLRSHTELVRYALRRGMFPVEENGSQELPVKPRTGRSRRPARSRPVPRP